MPHCASSARRRYFRCDAWRPYYGAAEAHESTPHAIAARHRPRRRREQHSPHRSTASAATTGPLAGDDPAAGGAVHITDDKVDALPFFFQKPARCRDGQPDGPVPADDARLEHELEMVVALATAPRCSAARWASTSRGAICRTVRRRSAPWTRRRRLTRRACGGLARPAAGDDAPRAQRQRRAARAACSP